MPPGFSERIKTALCLVTNDLLACRNAMGHWEGELSSSALSTATAVIALAVLAREGLPPKIARLRAAAEAGLGWLATNMNADGGWGDTTESLSNISTTALCWAAFGAVPGADEKHRSTTERAGRWLARNSASGQDAPHASARPPGPDSQPSILRPVESEQSATRPDPQLLAQAIARRYGQDRTFSAPILTACALAGRLGAGKAAWRHVLPLPFELAVCPHRWFAALRLPVVSYALPALIAIGYARHFHLPTRNPLLRLLRNLVRARALTVLSDIQPSSGGFLEATPLTSFVVMSLAGSGLGDHPVTARGLDFLLNSQRPDGSWPIDTNLATWVTTLAVNALKSAGWSGACAEQEAIDIEKIERWLLDQQHKAEHPYTQAAPGGWAWTDLPGGVPDADDTAGALLALRGLDKARSSRAGEAAAFGSTLPDAAGERRQAAAWHGILWLLKLQNRDGGIPTFCRGWGRLPFDRSSPDLTAHAIRAWLAWRDELEPKLKAKMDIATQRALGFLASAQSNDGSWSPLWFGNQYAPNGANPTYGTSKVIQALCAAHGRFPETEEMLVKSGNWLIATQDARGVRLGDTALAPEIRRSQADSELLRGWGGGFGVLASVEETALAVEALAAVLAIEPLPAGLNRSALEDALISGTNWLLARVASGEWTHPAPIGLYFASLWYADKLYPRIFTVAALGAVFGLDSLTVRKVTETRRIRDLRSP